MNQVKTPFSLKYPYTLYSSLSTAIIICVHKIHKIEKEELHAYLSLGIILSRSISTVDTQHKFNAKEMKYHEAKYYNHSCHLCISICNLINSCNFRIKFTCITATLILPSSFTVWHGTLFAWLMCKFTHLTYTETEYKFNYCINSKI